MMKTIEIQLIKNMIIHEDEIRALKYGIRTLYEYAPECVYDYYEVGREKLLIMLNSDLLTTDLVPMLSDFYIEYGDEKYSQQYLTVLHEFKRYDRITCDMCEKIGYEHSDAFDPVFSNNVNTKPYFIYENRIPADCTGITLHVFPPETATFSMLYTQEKEIQEKLGCHPLAKALKVCIR